MLNYLVTYIKNLTAKEEGQAMVEYGLIIALIAVVVVAALLILGPKIAELFEGVAGELPAVPEA